MDNKTNSSTEKNSIQKRLEGYTIPRHIAIIMDGNGRWAKRRGLARSDGHVAGAQALYDLVQDIYNIEGLDYLTVYAFSTENWIRPKNEVDFLMGLMKKMFDTYIDELIEKNVKVRILGDKTTIPKNILKVLNSAEDLTKNNTGCQFIIAFNYGGRREITTAAKKLAKAYAAGEVDLDEVDESTLKAFLYLPDVPDPDLVIRTSGEMRLSNFLLWESAYSEFYMTDLYWPDFTSDTLVDAIIKYNQRERRYGGVKDE